jgi:hypothetical protein
MGAYVFATGIPAGTTIASFTNSTTVVLSAAATATVTGVTVQISGYRASCTPSYVPAFAVPNFTVQIVSVSFWNGSAFPATCNAATDIGLQQLTLSVASSDGRTTERLVIVVRNPCGPGTSCA